MGAAQSVINDDQAQFRVRFTRARGFAALFERPENTYQWSGYGTLRVEPRGIQFRASRRGIGRTEARFVAGREISNVYREGDGVRVEFRDDAQQNVLNFWAEDSAAAASIVEQLPTVRTVEVEEATRRTTRPARRVFRTDLLVMGLGALILIGVSLWFLLRAPAPATQLVSMSSVTASDQLAPSVELRSASPALRSAPVEPLAPISATELKAMQQDFDRFAVRSEALRAQFDSAFKALLDGSLSQKDFADGLERWLIPQWASQEKVLRETHYAEGSQREAFRASLIGVTSNWHSGLEAYVSGLRKPEPGEVRRAFAYIGAAEESQRDAKDLLTR